MSCDSSEIKKSKNQNSYNFICKNWFMICLSFINIFYLWMWYYVFIYVKFDYNLYDVINIFYLWNMILYPYLCENWFMMCTSIFKYILCVRCDFVSLSLQKNYLLSIFWCYQWLNECEMWCHVYISYLHDVSMTMYYYFNE